MWIKLDDGFATHPKILEAGILAQAIQIRAICYASQNKTDGFIHTNAVPLLLTGLERIGVETATSELASFGVDADEIDWPAYMVEHHLWDVRPGGYYVHDYLDWNLSKKHYEKWKKKLALGGRKGMQHRWNKDQREITHVITQDITYPVTVSSTSISTLNPLNSLNSPNPDPDPDLESKTQTKIREHRLREFPPDFVLSDEMRSRAVALELNPPQEFAKFRDHHQAKGTKFKDWSAAWRTWIRRSVDMKEAR